MTEIIIPYILVLILQATGILSLLIGAVSLLCWLAWKHRDDKIIVGLFLLLAIIFFSILVYAVLLLFGIQIVVK